MKNLAEIHIKQLEAKRKAQTQQFNHARAIKQGKHYEYRKRND